MLNPLVAALLLLVPSAASGFEKTGEAKDLLTENYTVVFTKPAERK